MTRVSHLPADGMPRLFRIGIKPLGDAKWFDADGQLSTYLDENFDIPLVVLRGISDGVADVSHIDDWTRYLHIIDEKLAAAINDLERTIAKGTIPIV